jgi:hypothetical protein
MAMLFCLGGRQGCKIRRPARSGQFHETTHRFQDGRLVRDIFRPLAAPPRDLNRLRLAITQNF